MLTFVSVIAYTFDAQAQKKINYGIKAGLNLSESTFTPYYYDEKKPKAGFQVGFTGEYNLSAGLFVQSELMFSTKGVVFKGTDIWIGSSNPPVTHWKNIVDQLYVQVPVKLAYKINIGAETRFFVNAGYYAAYGLGGNDKVKNHYEGVDKPDETLSRYTFKETLSKRYDGGITTGIGVDYKKWTIGLNYEHGLNDIHYSYKYVTNTDSYKNRNLSVTFGYRLQQNVKFY